MKIKISGFRYFNATAPDEKTVSVPEGTVLEQLLIELGLEPDIIGYFILNGTPLKRGAIIPEGGNLKLIPFLSGG
ncbi:hypothetical protein KAR04_09630 [Candidatus Calescamantes bacterium]|nr:hypothetical protein [Candidatus Calescamantes bacterium]